MCGLGFLVLGFGDSHRAICWEAFDDGARRSVSTYEEEQRPWPCGRWEISSPLALQNGISIVLDTLANSEGADTDVVAHARLLNSNGETIQATAVNVRLSGNENLVPPCRNEPLLFGNPHEYNPHLRTPFGLRRRTDRRSQLHD